MTASNGDDAGKLHFEKVLRARETRLTASERAVATYFRDNLPFVPFETGASLAAKIGVSEMTVIRFTRSLGYANLRELKHSLRAGLAEYDQALDDVLERFQVRRDGLEDLRESLELELRAVIKAYELTATERWQQIVRLLAERRHVHVVGYQASKGIALDFASRLKYARGGVFFVEDTEGVHVGVLEADPDDACLVLVDTVAYARKGILLARKARELGIPVVIVTDRFTHLAYEITDLVLQGYTHIKTFWDSTSSLTTIANLLINSVAAQLGAKAEERYRFMTELGTYFQEFEPSTRASEIRDKRGSGPPTGPGPRTI